MEGNEIHLLSMLRHKYTVIREIEFLNNFRGSFRLGRKASLD